MPSDVDNFADHCTQPYLKIGICRALVSSIESAIRQAITLILVQATHQPPTTPVLMCHEHDLHHVQQPAQLCRSHAQTYCSHVTSSMTSQPTQTTVSAAQLRLHQRLRPPPPLLQAAQVDANAHVVWGTNVPSLLLAEYLG